LRNERDLFTTPAAAVGINRRRSDSWLKAVKGDTAMGDESVLLDHARRYFTQAGQSGDIKKMRMLVELGLEFLRLAQHGQVPHTGAGTAAEATDPALPTAQDEDDAGNPRT
jgi:hypothetical protein